MTTREAIESALVEDPDDRASHAAYADLLHEQGDPRGDLIQTQLALEDAALKPAERKRLQAREKALLKKHQREWLGPLAPFLIGKGADPENSFRLERGWIAALAVRHVNGELIQALAGTPLLKLCTELHLRTQSHDESEETSPPWSLANLPHLSAVRVLRVGLETSQEEDAEMVFVGEGIFLADQIPELVARMPHVEELHLIAPRLDAEKLFNLPMPRLRILKAYLAPQYPLAALAANASLGNLTHLMIHPIQAEPPTYTAAGVDALCRSPHLKSLTHLQLRYCPAGDAVIESLITSGLLARLTHLDLGYGYVTDVGATRLAATELPRMQRLDLSGNRLTAAGNALLRRRGWFHAGRQWQGEVAPFVANIE